ncbi:MAG TPA: hypothetical protein VGI95_14235 [Caulobacteraceae bacterium]
MAQPTVIELMETERVRDAHLAEIRKVGEDRRLAQFAKLWAEIGRLSADARKHGLGEVRCTRHAGYQGNPDSLFGEIIVVPESDREERQYVGSYLIEPEGSTIKLRLPSGKGDLYDRHTVTNAFALLRRRVAQAFNIVTN